MAISGERVVLALAVIFMCGMSGCLVEAKKDHARPISSVLIYGKRNKVNSVTRHEPQHRRRLASLVQQPPLVLDYHNGPVMSTRPLVPVYVIWYGSFKSEHMCTFRDFFSCFNLTQHPHPSVKSWWSLTSTYKDNTGSTVSEAMHIHDEMIDKTCSRGLSLTSDDLEALVVSSLSIFPTDPNAMYLVLTADNVYVDDFCTNSCASHFSTRSGADTNGHQLPYLWVGNSGTQCPAECAWPFAKPESGAGPQVEPLIAPNGDVGIDGMIINLAAMLAGSATNPFNSGFYQGDPSAPLEAATACTGMFGVGSYPGFPGELMVDNRTGASFNARGVMQREFLLPALWDPTTQACTAP